MLEMFSESKFQCTCERELATGMITIMRVCWGCVSTINLKVRIGFIIKLADLRSVEVSKFHTIENVGNGVVITDWSTQQALHVRYVNRLCTLTQCNRAFHERDFIVSTSARLDGLPLRTGRRGFRIH